MGGAASLRLFRNPNFRALWIGQLISIFGDRFTYLALLALAVERAADSSNPAPELALIPVVSFLPAILLAPWIGALVDGWNTRATLLLSDAARGVIVLAIIPAVAWGGLSAAFALVFLLYVANTFFLPARSAILPDLVEREQLVEANSLATLAGVIATVAGSVLGGFWIESAGWRYGLALDAATYFVSVAFLALIRTRPRPRPRRADGPRSAYRVLLSDVREGARLSLASPRVLGAIGAMALLWTAGGVLHVSAPILIDRRGCGMISGMGTLLGLVATGMVAGTLLLAARGRRPSMRARLRAGLVGAGLALLGFAGIPHPVAFGIAAVSAGFFVAILLVTTEAMIQESIAAEARARVFALRDFLARLGVLASAWVFASMLKREWLSSSAAIAVAGALLVVGGLAVGILSRGRSAPS